jgi:hypothetical protein
MKPEAAGAAARAVSTAAAAVEAPVSTSAAKLSPIEMWNGKRLQTQVLPLAQNTIAIRSLDYDRDRFDIEFG